jgi:hypothetical protein
MLELTPSVPNQQATKHNMSACKWHHNSGKRSDFQIVVVRGAGLDHRSGRHWGNLGRVGAASVESRPRDSRIVSHKYSRLQADRKNSLQNAKVRNMGNAETACIGMGKKKNKPEAYAEFIAVAGGLSRKLELHSSPLNATSKKLK